MAKKKDDQRKTKRRPIQFPSEWASLANAIAAHHRQPTLWLMITLIEQEAKKIGLTDLPPFPWDNDGK